MISYVYIKLSKDYKVNIRTRAYRIYAHRTTEMNRIGEIHRPTDNARPRVGFDVLHLISDVLRQWARTQIVRSPHIMSEIQRS